MKNLLLITISLLFCQSSIISQINCEYQRTEEEIERYRQTKAYGKTQNYNRDITNIPISFHIIGTDDGENYLPEMEVFSLLCKLNESFADSNMSFYNNSYPFDYINNTSLCVTPSNLNPYKTQNTLNIFIYKRQDPGNFGLYTPLHDYIVLTFLNNNYTSILNHFTSHLIGHYFSLPHTFTETGFLGDCPNLDNGINEYVTREIGIRNCETAADGFCDTEAEFSLSFLGGNCMDNQETDACGPLGLPYISDYTNPMSSFPPNEFYDCPITNFSDEQNTHMNANLLGRINANILNTNQSTSNNILDTVANIIVMPQNTTMNVSWDLVQNADFYYVEISRSPSFQIQYQLFNTVTTSIDISNLTPNKSYYINITPVNQFGGCSSSFDPENPIPYATHVSTIKDTKLNWNVVSENDKLIIKINSNSNSDARLTIFNNLGQPINLIDQVITNFNNSTEIDVSNYMKGLYFISLKIKGKTYSKKIII